MKKPSSELEGLFKSIIFVSGLGVFNEIWPFLTSSSASPFVCNSIIFTGFITGSENHFGCCNEFGIVPRHVLNTHYLVLTGGRLLNATAWVNPALRLYHVITAGGFIGPERHCCAVTGIISTARRKRHESKDRRDSDKGILHNQVPQRSIMDTLKPQRVSVGVQCY
jgi:hypothetical protein